MSTADLTRPNPAAGNRPGALRFADEEGRKTFINAYTGSSSHASAPSYAVSPTMAISGGYSVSNRPATAHSDGEFGGPESTGYNGSIAVNRTTRPTPNAQDPVMFLSDPYPNFAGTLPNRDLVAAEQPGSHGDHRRRVAARALPQFQRDAPQAATLPASR